MRIRSTTRALPQLHHKPYSPVSLGCFKGHLLSVPNEHCAMPRNECTNSFYFPHHQLWLMSLPRFKQKIMICLQTLTIAATQ